MTTSYYPGGGVMIETEPDTIYAELDAQDKSLWEQNDPNAVARIERELLRRSLNRRLVHYRIIEANKHVITFGEIAALQVRYGG